MASIVAWLIGFLFLGIGGWILMLRFEGVVDLIKPHNMLIGRITVDGLENQAYAELLRARFDYHFRHPLAVSRNPGFLEVVSFNAPDLFQPPGFESKLDKMTVDISGVDVARIIRFVNQLARPDQWVIEGDFQTQPDRALLALRFSRGDRLIRTWYLERAGNPGTDKSVLLQPLIDDAIFQLVYDFGNRAERDSELRKWQDVMSPPADFPNRSAVAAYYQGRGALARYYSQGDWKDLDVALVNLQALRGQMPEFEDGLQLLALALAEKRNEQDAIHVYEQARLVLSSKAATEAALSPADRRRVLSIDLLKATATAKLDTWQSTHEAIAELVPLETKLRGELSSAAEGPERTAYHELLAHTAVQLAYTYALYLTHLRDYTVAEVFGNPEAPADLRVSPAEISTLRTGDPKFAKPIVRGIARKVADRHLEWLKKAKLEQAAIEGHWGDLQEGDHEDGEQRRRELATRISLVAGFAAYHMAEWESDKSNPDDTVFGETFDAQLNRAQTELSEADAAHPNHYLVLQLLGLVYSEPRRGGRDLSLAEQYFERAIHANPFDYYGHELLADLLLRRVASRGVDLSSRDTMEHGRDEARQAVGLRETSGTAHLLWAQSLAMLLEIERDPEKRRELRATLAQQLDQAARFRPRAFNRPDPDLTWLQAVAGVRQLGDELEDAKLAQHFAKSKQDVEKLVDELIGDCHTLENRWVANQRVAHVISLDQRAQSLLGKIKNATAGTWRDIDIQFW